MQLALTYYRRMFPGFGIATVAFAAYVLYDDYIVPRSSHGAHDDPHRLPWNEKK